jgi:RNA polymerase sigma-70 factor (ECF subfamily)
MTQPDFTTLYDQHVERIYRYLLARTGSVQEAEDLTAETFHAALQGYANYRPEPFGSSPAAWLTGIAHHKLVDHFRRRRPGLALEQAEQQPGLEPGPEEQANQRLELARVAAALRRLPPERAEAVALHYFGELSMLEVGRAMGKSEEAAKKLVQRGLSELRQQLAGPPPGSLAAKGAAQ